MRLMGLLTVGMAVALVTAAQAATPLHTEKDKLSYAMGIETGRAFKAHNVNLNSQAYTAGMHDGLTGAKPQMSEKEVRGVLTAFQKQTMAQLQQQQQQAGSENEKMGVKFLEENKTKPGVVTTASGLQYKILTAGNGVKPSSTDTVTVDYEGKLVNGKVFDSSYQRGEPISFPVNGVIKGWQEALQLMPTGSTWELYIPSELAYGKTGAPGAIGPNEMLIFKVHLIKIDK